MNIFQRLKILDKIQLYTNQKYFNIFKEIFLNDKSYNKKLIKVFDLQSKYNKKINDYTNSKLKERISNYWENLYHSFQLKKMNYIFKKQNDFISDSPEFISEIVIKYLQLLSKKIYKFLILISVKFNYPINYLKEEYINLCTEEIKIIYDNILSSLRKNNKKKLNPIYQTNKNYIESLFKKKKPKLHNSSTTSLKGKNIIMKKYNNHLHHSHSLISLIKNTNEENKDKKKGKYLFDNEINSIAQGKYPSGYLVEQFLKQTDFDSPEKKLLKKKCKKLIKVNSTSSFNKIKLQKKYKFTNKFEDNKNNNQTFRNTFFPNIKKNDFLFKKNKKNIFLYNRDVLNFSTRNSSISNRFYRNWSNPQLKHKFFLSKEDMFYQ